MLWYVATMKFRYQSESAKDMGRAIIRMAPLIDFIREEGDQPKILASGDRKGIDISESLMVLEIQSFRERKHEAAELLADIEAVIKKCRVSEDEIWTTIEQINETRYDCTTERLAAA